jgi:GntR family transcriptional repressor for pyruvate dehydrogenase complex
MIVNKNNNLFDPIHHESVVDEVVNQIETMIISGILKEGRKLPSEREMAEVLQVSRPKVREALKRLESSGLIVSLHGGGTFVGELTGKAMSPALTELYSRHESAFFDFLEYRREQEGFAAELAAERATDIDREIITDILKKLDKAYQSGNQREAREVDFLFHSVIVDASHNTTLIHMMSSIYELAKKVVFYNLDYLNTLENSAEKLQEQHHRIAKALFKRDPLESKRAARDHVDYVELSFRKRQEQRRRDRISSKMKTIASMNSQTEPKL